jgi:hypothetical protein
MEGFKIPDFGHIQKVARVKHRVAGEVVREFQLFEPRTEHFKGRVSIQAGAFGAPRTRQGGAVFHAKAGNANTSILGNSQLLAAFHCRAPSLPSRRAWLNAMGAMRDSSNPIDSHSKECRSVHSARKAAQTALISREMLEEDKRVSGSCLWQFLVS